MIHIKCVQGSDLWHRVRLKMPTASEADKLVTAKKWEITTSELRRRYAHRLVTEAALNIPLDAYVTPAMLHGRDWEPKARTAYELQQGVEVELCGFCTNDEGTFGASPDAFVGDDGSLEIKCPENPAIHMGYLLNPDSFRDAHWLQVQAQLYVTRRKWTDLISYFQGLPMVCLRLTPHPEFQAKFDAAVKQFVQDLKSLMALAEARGVTFPEPEADARAYSDWLSEEDVEAYLASLQERKEGGQAHG